MNEQITISALYDLNETIAADIFKDCTYPWEVLAKIGDFIKELGKTLPEDEYEQRAEDVWVAKSATVYPTAYINGPCIIGNVTAHLSAARQLSERALLSAIRQN